MTHRTLGDIRTRKLNERMYNGWRNRETWLVNVWFGDMFTDEDTEQEWSAEAIESFVQDYVYEQNEVAGFIADMIDLSCIDYEALAEHLKE
jgi:4-aminobutyrate aminotransferase-like enzyme